MVGVYVHGEMHKNRYGVIVYHYAVVMSGLRIYQLGTPERIK